MISAGVIPAISERICDMQKKRKTKNGCLEKMHPVSLLFLFATVILISMFSGNPLVLALSVLTGQLTHILLCGKKRYLSHLRLMIILAILTAVLNPLFNHRGRTVLTRLPGGNVLTLEAVFYGLYAAMILISVLTWFACFNAVFDTDKQLYVFGKLSPALSMTISMALHFVPEFISRARDIRKLNKSLYADSARGIIGKIRRAMVNFGALLSWALESSVKKAESMKARAYGSGKRSMYSIFRWHGRDFAMITATFVLAFVYILLHISGALKFWFYPVIYGELTAAGALAAYFSMFALGLIPAFFDRAR